MLVWDDLRLVLAISRARSLTAAARALGVNQSTVTRRLAALHASLGEPVLERRGGAYVLTGFGESLRPHLAAMEEQALAIDRATHGAGAARGTVRLTTVETLATCFLAPRLPSFRALHPGILLELDVSRASADLSRREADLALRLVRPRQAGLVIRKLATIAIAPYATRRAPRALIAGDESDAWSPEARLLASIEGAPIALRATSWLAQLAAAEAGVGIAALPCFIADTRPSLARVGKVTASRELWLLVHRDLRDVARVRAVADWLAAELSALRPTRPPARARPATSPRPARAARRGTL